MADSWITDANKFFVTTYNNLADATKNGASWVAEQTSGSVTWIWGTLKGNWEPNRSDSQIIADAALGFIPLVGQVLDVRDLIACVYALKNEKDTNSQVYKWIDLVLAILGTIPGAGDIAKAVLKIIFLKIRRFGANHLGRAIKASIEPIKSLMRDEQVVKVIGHNNLKIAYQKTISKCRSWAGSLNAQTVLNQWKVLNDRLSGYLYTYRHLIPDDAASFIRTLLADSQRLLNQAAKPLQDAVERVKKILNEIANELEKELGGAHVARVSQKTPVRFTKHDPNIVRKWSNAKKGLYGEIISDDYMRSKGFKNMLPESRQVRSLEDVPKGRGIDGVYELPPPPESRYVVTETKFRNAAGEYVDSDGSLTKAKSVGALLGNTQGSGKQMSEKWIKDRLFKEVGKKQADTIHKSGYESWLMIVGPDGEVAEIYKLNAKAEVIGTVKK